MKHWDLVPGETVTLRRGVDHQEDDDFVGTRAVFRFHTTNRVCFEQRHTGELLEFLAADDGALIEEVRDRSKLRHQRRWHVVGRDRETRTVIRESIGERKHFTIGSEQSIARAAKAGA